MALTSLSTADLQAELHRRQSQAQRLETRRAKLIADIASIDAELSALGLMTEGPVRAKPRRSAAPRTRAKNSVSLPDAIAAAMDVGAEASPAEMADLVRKNGYKSTAAKFGMIVSNAMSKDERFKRLGRGLYRRIK